MESDRERHGYARDELLDYNAHADRLFYTMTVFNRFMEHLLEDPLGLVLSVLDNTIGEPAESMKIRYLSQAEASKIHLQADLLLRALNRVRAVADVAADSEGEVATDGAYGACTCLIHVRASC